MEPLNGSKKLSRREMLKASAALTAAATLAACAPAAAPTPAPVQEAATEAPVAPTAEPEAPAAPTAEPAAPVAEAPAQATGTVTIMHFRHEFTEDQEAQFETENPGIQVEFVDADQTAFYARYAAGTPPDLYRLQAPSIPQMLARDLLFDLTEFFQLSSVVKMDDLAPANNYYKAEDPLHIGKGKIYGMCKDFSPDLTIFANKALFDKSGVTVPDDTKAVSYDELMALSKDLTVFEGDKLVQLGYGYETAWVDRMWMVMLAELGQSLYSPNFDKIVLTGNEDAAKAAKWYYDMAEQKLTISPVLPSPAGWFGNDFTASTLAMAQYGFWYSAMAESDSNRGSVVMLPAPTWTGERLDPTITATGMIMTAATQVPEAAWKLFEWYNGGQPSVDRAKSGWGVPALKSQWPLIPQESPFQQQANKVLNGELALNTPPVQFNPFIGETVVVDSWNKNLDQALKGDFDFETLLANVETEVNLAIKEGIDRIMS
jgi:multiple sugar transport system substrate-binding protein